MGDKYEASYPFDPTDPPQTKPLVWIYQMDADSAYTTIRAHIDAKTNIPSDLEESYLYAAADRLKVYVNDRWESYGLVICRGAGEISPQNLVEARLKGGNAPALNNPPPSVTDAQHKTLCTTLLSIYRLGQIDKVKVGQYYTTMEGKIQGLLRVSTFDDEGKPYMLAILVQKYAPWAGLPTNERLVAAYDMVLEKAASPWTVMTITSLLNACIQIIT